MTFPTSEGKFGRVDLVVLVNEAVPEGSPDGVLGAWRIDKDGNWHDILVAKPRRIQAKDIDSNALIALIRECNEARCDYSAEAQERGWGAWHGGRPGYGEGDNDPPVGHWANLTDLTARLSVPEKVLRAKLKKFIKQGRITGCACGCRGDFEVVEGVGCPECPHPDHCAGMGQCDKT